LTPDCDADYDLWYAAAGRGKPNKYGGSAASCNLAKSQGLKIYRLDPSDQEAEEGTTFSCDNFLRVQHRRCSDCGDGILIGDPADNGVERYDVGDSQIKGLAREVNGVAYINAMSYIHCGARFYAPSQIARMKVWATQESWVFSQQHR
jgi:hypothetical protein